MSVGVATLAASITKPRDWAYSKKVSLKRGATLSAVVTMAVIESGITTGNTPPKKAQAASKPSMTASVVWENVGHTNWWRL